MACHPRSSAPEPFNFTDVVNWETRRHGDLFHTLYHIDSPDSCVCSRVHMLPLSN
jgi:hypothetical protein